MSDRIQFLGTSDGLPSGDRYHASLLLQMAGQTILLDAGEPCSHTLKRMGVDFDSIDAVFITHTHSDHVGGLPMLIQSMWLEQRERPLPLWMPRRAIAPLKRWLHACYLYEPLFKFPLEWHGLEDGTTAHCGNVRVRAFRTSHLNEAQRRFATKHSGVGFDAFSLLLEAKGKRLAYSGDIGRPEDLEALWAVPLDLLIVELAHCPPDRILEFLQNHPVEHVAFTHLSRSAHARLKTLRKRAVQGLRPMKVTFPSDGDAIRF
jgi:ribonuclease Z